MEKPFGSCAQFLVTGYLPTQISWGELPTGPLWTQQLQVQASIAKLPFSVVKASNVPTFRLALLLGTPDGTLWFLKTWKMKAIHCTLTFQCHCSYRSSAWSPVYCFHHYSLRAFLLREEQISKRTFDHCNEIVWASYSVRSRVPRFSTLWYVFMSILGKREKRPMPHVPVWQGGPFPETPQTQTGEKNICQVTRITVCS